MPAWQFNKLAWAAILAACLLVRAPALAQMDMQRAMDADRVVTKLIEEIRSSGSSRDVPRLSDPVVAIEFAAAFDNDIFGDGELRMDDLPLLSALQRHAGELARAYIRAGLAENGQPFSAEELNRAASNFQEFLPEIAVAYDFGILAGAHIARLTADLAETAREIGEEDPSISRSVALIAERQERFLEMLLGCTTDPKLRNSWRQERLELMNRTATDFAALLGKKSSQSIADKALAAAIAEEDSQVAVELKQFALSLLR